MSGWMRVAFIAAAVAVLILTGCGRSGSSDAGCELTVLCGSSFVKPLEELSQAFSGSTGIKVVSTFSGSEDFLPLIKAGERGDVLITHDPYLDYVRAASAYAGHVTVGRLAPVLAVQKGNPKGLTSLQDLTRPGLRVALSNPEYSTCGEMVFALLEKKGLRDQVLANVGNRLTKGHNALGTYLKTGTVDAVIMWNGVAQTFGEFLDSVPIPYEYDQEIAVHVIGLGYSRESSLVFQFLDFATQRGPEIFSRHGYFVAQ